MEMPLMDVVSVATVMQAWVNQKRPEKAEEWLSRLESWQRDESRTHLGRLLPNKVVYTTVLSGWAKAGNAQNALDILERQMASFSQGNVDCRPDTATFNCVLDALAKSKDRTGWAPKMAQHVLEQMEEFGTPDAHTWTTLISCFVRHKPSEAEKLLRQLEENGAAVPVSAYNAMLSGYAHTGNVRAATNLLAKLEASNESSPDIVSYNTVLSAYGRLKTANATQQAETFFRRILEQKGITANVATYGAMMKCWSKSSDADAADRVEAILRGMKDTGPAPNTACYNIVLSAWGNQAALRGRNDSYALDRMIQVFEEMATGDTVRPDDNTFRALMHAILGSSTPNKGEVLDFLVPLMKRHGFRPSGKDEQLFRRCLKQHSQWKAGELP
jgi:pentatricopeptide repeat protein